MLKIINPVNAYRQPLSRKMKKKKKKKIQNWFICDVCSENTWYISKYIHFCNKHAIQNTVIHMYGIPVYDKT